MCRGVSTSFVSSSAIREIPVAWDLAAELRDRCIRADDPFAREVAARMLAAGATRPVTLTYDQLAALLMVLDR